MRETGIQVIARAAAILRACKSNEAGMSLGNIAEDVKLPRSTVQRIVNALITEGLLQNSSAIRSIRLGPEIYALAENTRSSVLEVAHPFLKKLSEQTGETVDLAIFKRDHMVFIDQVAGSHRLRAVSAVGDQFPLLTTANGRAALSLLNAQELAMALPAPAPQRILKLISAIHKTGIAVDNEEHSSGICALGTAFKDLTGVIYAISIPMPSVRFVNNRKVFQAALLQTRQELVAALA
jgi:DNA-binding IclR family transcriptional regulator